MRQTVTVVRGYSDGHIEVELTRAPACGAACSSCTGCSAPKNTVRVKARGGAGAKPGDTVVIESGSIITLAVLVYLLPLALFFAGYAISAFVGGLGFALGIGLLVPLNKIVGRRMIYNVVE